MSARPREARLRPGRAAYCAEIATRTYRPPRHRSSAATKSLTWLYRRLRPLRCRRGPDQPLDALLIALEVVMAHAPAGTALSVRNAATAPLETFAQEAVLRSSGTQWRSPAAD